MAVRGDGIQTWTAGGDAAFGEFVVSLLIVALSTTPVPRIKAGEG